MFHPASLVLLLLAVPDGGPATADSDPTKPTPREPFSLHAPVRPVLQDADKEPLDTWTGTVNAGGFLSLGNTERRSANLGAEAIRRGEDDRITLGFAWDYSEEKSRATNLWTLTQRRTSGRAKYDYFLSKHSYLWASALVEGDTPADIDVRYAFATGYGHQWVERKDLSFLTELGLAYFAEHYRTAGVFASETVALRAAYALRWQVHEKVKLLQDVEAFPGLEESDDIFVRKDSRVQLSVTEKMFTQLQWILDYDNTPSPGRERLDHRFFLSIGWSF
jgi:putative salt-induced outer membrane protein YdiY